MTADGAPIDPYRSLIFPNNIRHIRKHRSFPKLLGMSARLSQIPYIRLSKIERGEVFAKPEELTVIADLLGVAPADLLIDAEATDFDIGIWANGLGDWEPADPQQDRLAVLLAAAVRALRASDSDLSIRAIGERFGIAPVILSRVENAFKPLDRWNRQTLSALCRIFDVSNVDALRETVLGMEQNGLLDAHIGQIADPERRISKSRKRIAELMRSLESLGTSQPSRGKKQNPLMVLRTPASSPVARIVSLEGETTTIHEPLLDLPSVDAPNWIAVRLVPVFGLPMADGLIAKMPVHAWVEAPRSAGDGSYGLRVCRPSLGLGLPASATVIVDPSRFPSGGGIAVVEEVTGLRLLAITFDRQGRMMGYSESPDHEVNIDDLDPARVAMVIGAVM
jgi:hypothetical protein